MLRFEREIATVLMIRWCVIIGSVVVVPHGLWSGIIVTWLAWVEDKQQYSYHCSVSLSLWA